MITNIFDKNNNKIYNNCVEDALIIKNIADNFWVSTNNQVVLCKARGNLKSNSLFVGDKVVINKNIIEKVYARKNLLIRPPLANLDQLIIVIAKEPKPDFMVVDKLILFCKEHGIEPILCLNKTDLECEELIEYVNFAYKNVVDKIIFSSIKTNNITEILKILEGKISAFAGQSAVGKSALVKILKPSEEIISGELSKRVRIGKNTTRHTTLYEISPNTYIADTSGFSALDIKFLSIPYYELPYYYKDYLPYHQKCKYKSCLHIKEDGCEVIKTVTSGKLDNERYKRYCINMKSLQDLWEKTHG